MSTDISRAAGNLAALGLAGAAAVHLLWAAGSSWPAKDDDELANLVVGRPPFPSRPATGAVAGALLTASAIVMAANRPVAAQSRVAQIGPRIVAAALLGRGAVGLTVSALGLGQASEQFRRWDLRLYSPLCIALGVCAAIGGGGTSSLCTTPR